MRTLLNDIRQTSTPGGLTSRQELIDAIKKTHIEPPRILWRLRLLGSRQRCWWRVMVVDVVRGLVLGRWDHAELGVQPAVVEPVDVVQRGVFDILKAAPGSFVANQLGLVEAVEGFGQGVVIAVTA